ncbi:MAG: hypothetical protein ABL874_02120 [Sphingopyxis sp.]
MRHNVLAALTVATVLATPVFALTQAGDSSAPAASTTPTTATTPDPDSEIRCRRIAVTGTLISRNRVCKTVGEWRRLANSGNDVARAIVESGRVCAGGPSCTGG